MLEFVVTRGNPCTKMDQCEVTRKCVRHLMFLGLLPYGPGCRHLKRDSRTGVTVF